MDDLFLATLIFIAGYYAGCYVTNRGIDAWQEVARRIQKESDGWKELASNLNELLQEKES